MGATCTADQFEDPNELTYQEFTKIINLVLQKLNVQSQYKNLSEIKVEQDFMRRLGIPSDSHIFFMSRGMSWLGHSLSIETISERAHYYTNSLSPPCSWKSLIASVNLCTCTANGPACHLLKLIHCWLDTFQSAYVGAPDNIVNASASELVHKRMGNAVVNLHAFLVACDRWLAPRYGSQLYAITVRNLITQVRMA